MKVNKKEENERIKKKLLLKKLNELRKKEKRKEVFIKENSRKLKVIPEKNFNDINRTIEERLPKSY